MSDNAELETQTTTEDVKTDYSVSEPATNADYSKDTEPETSEAGSVKDEQKTASNDELDLEGIEDPKIKAHFEKLQKSLNDTKSWSTKIAQENAELKRKTEQSQFEQKKNTVIAENHQIKQKYEQAFLTLDTDKQNRIEQAKQAKLAGQIDDNTYLSAIDDLNNRYMQTREHLIHQYRGELTQYQEKAQQYTTEEIQYKQKQVYEVHKDKLAKPHYKAFVDKYFENNYHPDDLNDALALVDLVISEYDKHNNQSKAVKQGIQEDVNRMKSTQVGGKAVSNTNNKKITGDSSFDDYLKMSPQQRKQWILNSQKK
jgi:hypothetical protein